MTVLFCQSAFSQSFTGVNPKNNEYRAPGNISFEWNTTGSASYTLQIADAPSFNNIIVTETSVTNQVTTTSPLASGIYYWRVDDGTQFSQSYRLNIFEPSADPNIELWLDPSVGIAQDGFGNISSWSDVNSGSGLSFSQSNGVNQPFYQPNGFSGLPHLEFNGSQFLNGGDVLDIQLESRAFYIIGSASGNDQAFIAKSIADGQPSRYSLLNLAGFSTVLYQDNTIRNVSQSGVITGNTLYNFNVNRSAAEISYYVNNNTPVTNTINSSFNMDSPFRFLIGAYNANPDNSEILHLNGSISEIIIIDDVSSTSRDNTIGYLRYKYIPTLDLGFDINAYGFCQKVLHGGSGYSSYLWSNGSTADSLVVSESGTYWVEVVDIFGFTSRDSIEVEFPQLNYPQNQLFCPGDSLTWYTNLGPNYNYLWSDGSTADSLSIDTPGNYHVQITDTNGCIFQSDTLTFNEDPFETIVDLGPDKNLCTGNELGLISGDSLVEDYLWSTGSTDSVIPMNVSGTYYLDVINSNGCEASDTIEITIIGDAPVVNILSDNEACQNHPFIYDAEAVTTDGSTIDTWQWSFDTGDSSPLDSGSYVYVSPGNYTLSLTVQTSVGCFKNEEISIQVHQQPELSFSNINDCQSSLIQFNGSQLTPTIINSWDWNFGDPSSGVNNQAVGQNTTHVFNDAGSYYITLIGEDINGCYDTVIQPIVIKPSPEIEFTFDEICAGDVVEFENQTSIAPPGIITGYNWSFGDGGFSNQTNPQRLYNTPGNYSVSLSASSNNGCTANLTKPLKIHAYPIVDASYGDLCAGIPIEFTDESSVPNGSVADVNWSFNDGPSLNGFNVYQLFSEIGTHTIEQVVSSAFGCTSSENFTVTLNDFLSADFEIQPNAFLAEYPTEFINLSVGGDNHSWTFGTYGSSTDENPTFIFPQSAIGNSVNVFLQTSNAAGCTDTVSMTLEVLERKTDLALEQLFIQTQNGFYVVGVKLKNRGSTPINSVDLFLRIPGNNVIKETWNGELQAGEEEIYVFSSSVSSSVHSGSKYVCVDGEIESPAEFSDENLNNNSICSMISGESGIIIMPYPNPVNDELTVSLIIPSEETGSLKIYDAYGKLVYDFFEEKTLEGGLNSFVVNTTDWRSGVYSIIYLSNGEKRSAKLVKL